MNFTKKIDRAFQWAGEKMGSEAKTSLPEEFKMLETEMALRFDGMDRLQKSMNAYVKWIARRGEAFEDKEKGLPVSYVGRTMISHGEDFESDSEFGNCLIAMGRADERVGSIQENYATDVTNNWLESLERSLAMMKEYQAARKKLENRRLAYDASITKMQKAKREDFRLEEELRTAKAKFEESSEDVIRRMQDIKDAEADSVRDLTGFLDAQLDYHERCAEELRRAKRSWPAVSPAVGGFERRPTGRSRSNTAHSYTESRTARNHIYEEDEDEPRAQPVRMPFRSNSRLSAAPPDPPARPPIGRAATFQGPSTLERRQSLNGGNANTANIGMMRGQLRPISRINTNTSREDVFADRDDDTTTGSGSGSPEWGERSASPATSMGSLSRSTSNLTRKAPPPPPPSRSKKPPPPVPAKREVGY